MVAARRVPSEAQEARQGARKETPMTNIVIASAARTAVGSFNGSFANTTCA